MAACTHQRYECFKGQASTNPQGVLGWKVCGSEIQTCIFSHCLGSESWAREWICKRCKRCHWPDWKSRCSAKVDDFRYRGFSYSKGIWKFLPSLDNDVRHHEQVHGVQLYFAKISDHCYWRIGLPFHGRPPRFIGACYQRHCARACYNGYEHWKSVKNSMMHTLRNVWKVAPRQFQTPSRETNFQCLVVRKKELKWKRRFPLWRVTVIPLLGCTLHARWEMVT